MKAFYEHKQANPSWDYSDNTQEMFEVWSKVLPTINGIDSVKWLSNVGILDGKPAPQRLYPVISNSRVYLVYPDTKGNFNWSHTSSSFKSQNIPNWFPTTTSGGKVKPSVANQPFNVNVKTIHGETAIAVSAKTERSSDGRSGALDQINSPSLPIGLYVANVEFPSFAKHTSNYKNQMYVIGKQHHVQSIDELVVRVGVDMPTAKSVQLELENKNFETQLVNGLAVFRFKEFGIDYTGMSTIRVSDGIKENVYKRSISHFGEGSNRVNDLLIIDKDFDGVEDLYDNSIVPLVSDNPTLFSDVVANASSLANLETTEVQENNQPTPPAPPTTGNPTKPAPPKWNYSTN